VGTFINLLPVHLQVDQGVSFRELLRQVRQNMLAVFDHSEVPFSELVATLRPARDASRTPFFPVLFNLMNVPLPPLTLDDIQVELFSTERRGAQFDLSLALEPVGSDLAAILEYNTDLYEAETPTRMLDHFCSLLAEGCNSPDLPLCQLNMLSSPERLQLLQGWNDTSADYPREACVQQLFTEQAQRTPERVGLEFENERWTYADLDQRANRLARLLREKGVGAETLVGICLERSAGMVLAVLATWKAGGAYVPLDPDFPSNRLDFMINDSGLKVVITDSALRSKLPHIGQDSICLDLDGTWIDSFSPDPLETVLSAESLAYVLYTSGSTGKPKGVQICHSAVVNFLCSMRVSPGISAEDVLLSVTSLSFDISVLELWLPLLNGARLAVASQRVAADGVCLSAEIEERGATIVQATPATWQMLILAGWGWCKGLKMLCGGEALPRVLAERLLDLGGELWNMYGPTETTIWSSITRVFPGEPIRIGPPIANTQFYILDAWGQPVPAGSSGELYIGGDGLARGYLNLPGLSAERFKIADLPPLGSIRIYQTGDLARWDADGRLEFLGRNDTQVKIRGFRVEIEEIETALKRHPRVSDAAVIAGQEGVEERRLAAYIVLNPGSDLLASELRGYLSQNLPSYMIPSLFTFLASLPLTPNRKVDRKALPRPDFSSAAGLTAFEPPCNELEARLVRLWEEVVDVHPVGVCDNFFELGGTSLMAIRLLAEVEKQLERSVPLTLLFEEGTVRHVATWLRGHQASLAWEVLVPIQPKGMKPPLFVVHPLDGDVTGFSHWVPGMDAEQPIYGLRAAGIDGISTPLETVEAMASRYIEAIRSIRPKGPYQLAGYCAGSLIAYEMAHQLAAEGETVTPLVLINLAPPGSGYIRLPYKPREWSRFLRNVPEWVRDILRLSLEDIAVRVRIRLPAFHIGARQNANLRIGEGAAFHLMMTPDDLREPILRYYHAMDRAFRSYRMGEYSGDVTILRTRRQPLFCSFDPSLGWKKFIRGRLTLLETPGSNTTIMTPLHARSFAKILNRCLED
jgi:amino acid adenylation domain-containing protein